MQLQIDPAVDAHGHYLLDITGPRAEGQTVECLYGAFLFVGFRAASFLCLSSWRAVAGPIATLIDSRPKRDLQAARNACGRQIRDKATAFSL